MGVVQAVSPCFGCNRVFAYNPLYVPSIRVNGTREPICQDCVNRVNPHRVRAGLAPIVPHREAYEPLPESDLPLYDAEAI